MLLIPKKVYFYWPKGIAKKCDTNYNVIEKIRQFDENKDSLNVVNVSKIKSFNTDKKYSVVTLGGMKWIVASMTESSNNDLIVALCNCKKLKQ